MKKVQLWNIIEIHSRRMEAQKRINKILEMKVDDIRVHAMETHNLAADAFQALTATSDVMRMQGKELQRLKQGREDLRQQVREISYSLEDVEDLRLMVYMSLVADAVLLFAVIYLLGK